MLVARNAERRRRATANLVVMIRAGRLRPVRESLTREDQ
jgi:hypothetical protein